MHPLHEYIAKQLTEKLKSRRVVVWYDPRAEFAPFIDEARGAPSTAGQFAPIALAGVPTKLIEFADSYLEIRAAIEPLVYVDLPEPLLVYVPSVERDTKASLLMEAEIGGALYEPKLKSVALNVLRKRYTDGVIDEMLAPDGVTYQDIARATTSASGGEPPSQLNLIFGEARGNDGILAAWLASDTHDAAIEQKRATSELVKLVRTRLGLDLPPEVTAIAKLRSHVLRYVLGSEFRLDLRCAPPASLNTVPKPPSTGAESAVRELAHRLRTQTIGSYSYEALADRVESELGLTTATLPSDALGSIDTFRFEERALLAHCGELIADGRFREALAIVGERENSFWLGRDPERKAQWQACRWMAELGEVAAGVRQSVASMPSDAKAWIEGYVASDGWHRLDSAQRRLEGFVVILQDEPAERPLGVVRRAYEDACEAMALGFTNALEKARWTVPGVLAQTRIQPEVLAHRPRPIAYFMVDAMRYEMGLDLRKHLPPTAEVSERAALVALPSITPVGMAALLPGAASSFSVVAEGDELGSRIGDTFMPGMPARRKHFAASIAGVVDLTLDEVLGSTSKNLAKKLKDAPMVVVRSQEIDHAGEAGFAVQARRIMDGVVAELARGINRLAAVGIEQFVVTADHGHLFFGTDRDESMRIDAPGGKKIEQHRRCWIGRGGATPAGCVRVTAAALGYASDLEFVFPRGSGVFRAGGDLAFHHGGLSLQEVLVPVITVRHKGASAPATVAAKIALGELPYAITNRFFSITATFGEKALFSDALGVRAVLRQGDKQVGLAGMAMDATLDTTTGTVQLQRGKTARIVFQLTDDTATSARIVLEDAATDAVVAKTDEIPIRLGV